MAVWVYTPDNHGNLIMDVEEYLAVLLAERHPDHIYFFAELAPVEVP